MATDIERPSPESLHGSVPPLRNGDRLSRAEFLRRYHAMPGLNHAELIEGRVCMPSPVSAVKHGEPHFDLITWLGVYRALPPGVVGGDNSTLNLDLDNSPQPDGYLRIVEQAGGQTRMVEGYLVCQQCPCKKLLATTMWAIPHSVRDDVCRWKLSFELSCPRI